MARPLVIASVCSLALLACEAPDDGPRDAVEPVYDDREVAANCFSVAPGVADAILHAAATLDSATLARSTATGGVGLTVSAAQAIVAARPIADMAELDAVAHVGQTACRALARHACDVSGNCRAELRVATWNVEHFPKTDVTEDAVVSVVEQLDIDVLGMQEIEARGPFEAVVEALEGWSGELGHAADTRVGALFDGQRVTVTRTEHLFTSDSWSFPRPVLAVTLALRDHLHGAEVTFVVVHLKAMNDGTSQSRREAGVAKLRDWIDARRAEGRTRFVLLGDFNDDLRDNDVFGPLLASEANVTALTRPLEQRGDFSYVPFPRLIDHMFATDETADALARRWTQVLALEEDWNGDFVETVSDHRPVLTTFTYPVRSGF